MNCAKKIQAKTAGIGIKISEKTFRCRLSMNFGPKSYIPAQKPCLTEGFGVCKKSS